MKLSRSQVQPYLHKLQAELGTKDHARLVALSGALDEQAHQLTVSAALAAAFAESRSLESQNKLLGQLRERFNDLAEEAGFRVRCEVSSARAGGADKRFLWFEGETLLEVSHTTDELTRVSANLIEDRQGLPLHTEPRISLQALHPGSGRPLVRWFASYAHADEKARDLIERLGTRLANNRHYHFETWDDHQLLVGEDWHAQIQQALQQCHLGVLLLSHEFLASRYIGQHELPAFRSGQDKGAPGKRAIPVALQTIDFANTDLKGLAQSQIYHDGDQKPYATRRGSKRDEWLDGLVAQMTQVLDRYADKPAASSAGAAAKRSTPAIVETSPRREALRLLRARDMLSPDMDRLPHLMTEVLAKPALLDERLLSKDAPSAAASSGDEGGVNVLEHLLDWAQDPDAPPLFALLGEYGMGKTISCQRLVREIEERREAAHAQGQATALPQALYFDLRKLTQLRSAAVPTLPQVIDECVQRGWAAACEKPSAAELIERSQAHALLWVFDGLDEALVHLSERQGQQFTQELLRLQPLSGHGSHPLTRVLISCRTHYFRTLREQNSHFTGQERGDRAGADYRALLMLPLGDTQILGYLQHALPGIDPQATLALVQSVHNLGELAERPFTLRLVSEFIPQIEHWRAQGRPVYGVTLYQEMVNRWIARDNGKHHLRAEHKQLLMAQLAAWMWREGQRLMPAGQLETWFHEWLAADPELQRLYAGVGYDKLDEDLRTATFLVREDGPSEGGAQAGGFRFAHSSMQEFFLAQHMFRALQLGQRAAWAMPLVSPETRQFLAQLLQAEGRAEQLDTLSAWRAPYLALASEQWLRYALDATAQRWPAPNLSGLDMQGADLHGWRFIGRSEQEPLNLSSANFANCELRETVWHDVVMSRADVSDAQLCRCEWWRVWADGLTADRALLDGAVFREVQWAASTWKGASGQAPWFLYTEAPEPWQAGEVLDGAGSTLQRRLPMGLQLRWRNCMPSPQAAACSWSPVGQHALSANWDNTLKFWHVASGRCLATWAGHENPVTACNFSPNGQKALSASHDKTLKLWQVASGRCLATWVGHEDWVTACSFSPDGQHALSASRDKTLKLWQVASGHCLATWAGHENPVTACSFSPDGHQALSASHDDTLKVWHVASGHCLATWAGHEYSVTACSFSPDGQHALSASDDSTLRLWHVASGRCLATWAGHERSVTACSFSPDGQHALSASDDETLKLWHVASGRCLATWVGHKHWVNACGYSPDGQHVLSASGDETLKLWHVASGRCLATWVGHELWVTACSFSPDGQQALSASRDKTLKLWHLASGRCLATWAGHEDSVNACSFSPDGQHALSASADNTLKLWLVASGHCLATWVGHENSVAACSFSPNGQHALSASHDKTLKLWQVASGRCLATWAGHEDSVTACSFSPDGQHALSASADNTLKLWQVASGRCLATWAGHEDSVNACTFSRDGQLALSCDGAGTLMLWRVPSGQLLRVHQVVAGDYAVWSGDRRELLSASAGAWRWLAAQLVDEASGELRGLWPAESLLSLPFNTGSPGEIGA